MHGIPAGLTLIDSTISTTGVFIGTYVPAGEIAIGSFALDPSILIGPGLLGQPRDISRHHPVLIVWRPGFYR